MATSTPSAILLRQGLGKTKIGIVTRVSRRHDRGGSGMRVAAYLERNTSSIGGLVSKVIGSLPVVGLVARIFSDEGGVGDDIVDFAEFRRRVGKKCSVNESRAFFEFQERRGRSADPLYVLMCCWLAAVGAGYLKSEEILEGMARLQLSNDIEFEEQTFMALMAATKEKRAKANTVAPQIPMDIRVEKALEAIYVCCYGQGAIEDKEEQRLISVMLNAVFASVGEDRVNGIVNDTVNAINRGDKVLSLEPSRLPKEAVDVQMKDLQFLKKWNSSSDDG
ncbi:photosystem I assembly factor PSA3, chloroplastic-like [Wolffia australiana]